MGELILDKSGICLSLYFLRSCSQFGLACGFWEFANYGNELKESFETCLTKHDANHTIIHANEFRSQFGKRTKIMKMLID